MAAQPSPVAHREPLGTLQPRLDPSVGEVQRRPAPRRAARQGLEVVDGGGHRRSQARWKPGAQGVSSARSRAWKLSPRQRRIASLRGMSDDQVMFTLDESEQVTHWYNIVADLPTPPPPPLHPGTREPVGPDDLAPLFPIELIMQEVSGERYVEIPGPVLDVYKQYRPSPLFRARRWEQKLGTPARIYYKYEGVSPGRLAQDQHRDPAGLLQLPARHTPADDRDRRRPVGHRAVVRLRALRGRVRGVAGRGVVRHEAPAPHPDRGLRRHGAPLAEPADRVGQGVRRGPPGLAGHRHLRGGRGRGAGREQQVRPRVGAQPRAAAPDGDRRGGAAPAREGRRVRRRPRGRLCGRRLQLRRAGVPVPAREARRQPGPRGSWRSSRARARR